ncbi:Bug family tripartite tricarboxylate transporter substrate binding protein [Chelatococcus asaccharovorans]|uniref:Bug family tripartite tricarboxylate transporter substrate binding protein n=1 Tax=Chelatococcus asaccharovorans TaxID=28210 RepID=UPI00224C705F|nr:tripartite tricarboxylate transporter substrate binding protein [Chelatococcus asaccharovorans]CAH1651630.1 Tripartite-type tricarboxylate transporter receptor subunit TctC [Chelatococcus asaccharovorans]CAH1686567.1 Tripartite-type tricarboxylate transporter receptor subunit TctC [Chelatococcus asaccharovorans]
MHGLARLSRCLGGALAFALAAIGPGHATDFPSRAITIVIPFPPGGGTDLIMRAIGQKASELTGQSFIIDNRGGAGGAIAAKAVKNAPPDGYTLLFGNSSTHAINKYIMKIAYDPEQDFVPVSEIMAFPHVLVVSGNSGVTSVDELIKLADSKPNGLTFATQGLGSGGQLLGEQLRLVSGKRMTSIPYQGGAPALLDTSAGRTDFMFSSLAPALPFIKQGTLRVLASSGSKRAEFLPDVPALKELGYPGVDLEFWFAVFAPAGTPQDVVAKLHTIFVRAIQSPEVARIMQTNSAALTLGDGAALGERVKRDLKVMDELTKKAGIAVK